LLRPGDGARKRRAEAGDPPRAALAARASGWAEADFPGLLKGRARRPAGAGGLAALLAAVAGGGLLVRRGEPGPDALLGGLPLLRAGALPAAGFRRRPRAARLPLPRRARKVEPGEPRGARVKSQPLQGDKQAVLRVEEKVMEHGGGLVPRARRELRVR